MSAIWGVIDLSGENIKSETATDMKKTYENYKIDRFCECLNSNVLFGCAHQHITDISVKEQLPIYEDGIYFTADAIIDNRKQLKKELGINCDISDGRLIFNAYKKWGVAAVNHLIGIFSFAVYDEKKKEFLLFTDHTSSRCINYYYQNDKIVFSTTYNAIIKAVGRKNINYNRKWIAGCESNYSADIIVFEGLTPFEEINQVKCGSYIRICDGRLCKTRYWNPLKNIKKYNFKSIQEYKAHFLQVFNEVVDEMMCSKDNTALMLSSGLDSAAVGSAAAKILSDRDEKLYTFTAIPHPDYKNNHDSYYIVNESSGAYALKKKYDNIEYELVDYLNKDALSDLKENIKTLEVPYKSAVNMPWLNEIYKRAYENQCRILLKGQYGNSTISYGAILTFVWQKMLSGHLFQAYKQLRYFKGRMKVSDKNIINVFLFELKSKIKPDISVLEQSIVPQSEIKKYKVDKKIRQMLKMNGGSIMDSKSQWDRFIYAPEVFQHISIFDTKNGLKNGIVIRDPTRDVRIIELCLSYPIDCFVIDGEERALVRNFMKNDIPQEILNIINKRGLQGADFSFRINNNHKANVSKIVSNIDKLMESNYFNTIELEKVKKAIQDSKKIEDKDCIKALAVCSLAAFFDEYGSYT